MSVIMSFVTVKPTLTTHLWLFVGLVEFGYTEDASHHSSIRGFNISTCSESQFECQNRECIRSELLCDGRGDCSDFSDETEFECARSELDCPTYAFRCRYGACIDRDVVCDGIDDCSTDGSDEDPLMGCHQGRSFGEIERAPLPQPSPINQNPPLPCIVPLQPINGQFQHLRILTNGIFEDVDIQNWRGETNSLLLYSCAPGYRIRGNSTVRCLPSGKWTRKPVCTEIRCPPLSSLSMMGNCTYANDEVIPCSDIDAVSIQTRAEVSCRPGYRVDMESTMTRSETVMCNENGKWKPEPIKCVPVCGITSSRGKILLTDTTTSKSGTFPWHADLYMQRNSSNGTEKIFRCSATVIEAYLLLTTAHCLYNFNLSPDLKFNSSMKILEVLNNFFVVTENNSPNSPIQESRSIREHRLKNVHTECNFNKGWYSSNFEDIAIVELEEPLEFTKTLLPACLDETGTIQQILDFRANRGVVTLKRSSQMLRITTMPEIPNSQCTTLYNGTQSPIQVGLDKFCTCFNDGEDTCSDEVTNNGGGLVYEIYDAWYLMGIVSQIGSDSTELREGTCGTNFQILYIVIAKHMAWIQRVISDLERYKYPPCSRHLPPFQTRIITRVSSSALTSTTTTMRTITPMAITVTSAATIIPPTLTITLNTIIMRESLFSPERFCSIPSQPAHGEWKLHRDFCYRNEDCRYPRGTLLRPGTQLVYSCTPGYKLVGNTSVYCRANGVWSPVPVCSEIKCKPLNSASLIATCSFFGERVDCSTPVSPNTQAKISCRLGYWAQSTHNDVVECNMTGMWEPDTFSCIPVCGAILHHGGLFVDEDIAVRNFPWHATLYIRRNSSNRSMKDIKCGATLIRANLLLTAAHCVYSERTKTPEDPGRLFVLMNNIHRHYDSPFHDPHSVRRGAVENVHIHCKYRGRQNNYVSDIALLELQEPFEFFNIQLHPACVDFSGYNEQVLQPGAAGILIGFGKTATGVPGDVLQTITVPYVSENQCKNANIMPQKMFISSDKFCAGYNNGTAVCLGDGGGGLFIQINGLWHILGIVSVDYSGSVNNGESSCDGKKYTLFTKISDYAAWILDVMFHLERYKSYPPCSPETTSPSSHFWLY